LKLLYASYLDL